MPNQMMNLDASGHQGHDQGDQQEQEGQNVEGHHIDGQDRPATQVGGNGDGLVDGRPSHAGTGLPEPIDLPHGPVGHVLLVVISQGSTGVGFVPQPQHMVGYGVGADGHVLVPGGMGLGQHSLDPLDLGGHHILGPVGQEGRYGVGVLVSRIDVQAVDVEKGSVRAEETTNHRLVALVGTGDGEILGDEEPDGVTG